MHRQLLRGTRKNKSEGLLHTCCFFHFILVRASTRPCTFSSLQIRSKSPATPAPPLLVVAPLEGLLIAKSGFIFTSMLQRLREVLEKAGMLLKTLRAFENVGKAMLRRKLLKSFQKFDALPSASSGGDGVTLSYYFARSSWASSDFLGTVKRPLTLSK